MQRSVPPEAFYLEIVLKAIRSAKIIVSGKQAHAESVVRLLAETGFNVQLARTGTEILTLAADNVDAVVLDITLSDVNGFEVCRRLKAHATTAHIAVVFVSSLYGIAEGAAIASRLGAVAYLTKPVESRDLINVINLAICKEDLLAQRSRQAARSA
jgi:DNA-binding response OmpR family regulator